MNVFHRAGMASAVLALAACASPRLENLRNPAADLEADTAACKLESERAAKLDQLARPPVFQDACAACSTSAQNRQLHAELGAFGVQKRCMAAKGWQQVS
jgi:hypothetical protein